jgi:hypothetical protein
MENQLDDNNWELKKRKLIEALTEEADCQGLAVGQRAIIHETILKPLDEDDESSRNTAWFFGYAMVGWLKIGFLPSEWKISLAEIVSKPKDIYAPPGAELAFWLGLASKELFPAEDERAKQYFDDALKDVTLPQGIHLASLNLKVWCQVGLGEYDEADVTLTELRNGVSSFANKYYADYLMGFISALSKYGITAVDMPVKMALSIDGEIVPETTGKRGGSEPQYVALPVDALIKMIREEVTMPVLISECKTRKEIAEIPVTRTPEEFRQKFVTEYGDWVNKLANQGALVNAEFLYEALSARSWGEIVMGYANAMEEEIRRQLLRPLQSFLRSKTGNNILSVGQKFIKVHDRCDTADIEGILSAGELNQLKEFYLPLTTEAHLFLFDELPRSLEELRKLRNPSAHGIVMNANEAKQIRKLVLGTSKKAGLLKRLTEINLG